MAIILSVNAGSSSVKVSVYRASKAHSEPEKLADAQVAGLTSPPALLSYASSSSSSSPKPIKDQEIKDASISSQADAFQYILSQIESDASLGDVASKSKITHVVHRIVHGGSYASARLIDDSTLSNLSSLSGLAPLHNGAALAIVSAARSKNVLPGAKHIAAFDSAFHQTLPLAVRTYAIDREEARKKGLRRYGFHGISYAFVTDAVASHLGKEAKDVSLIVLHLGSGASACAIKDGRSVDTSMGLTPASGLPGATRAGDVDAALVFHMVRDAGREAKQGGDGGDGSLHVTVAEEILNQRAGWKALAGTADFGEISAAAERAEAGGGEEEEDEDDDESKADGSKLAFDLLVDRIVGYVGAYYLKLDGRVDALVFAGGIGEKAARLRAEVARRCRPVGFEVDAARNEDRGDDEDDGKEAGRMVRDVGSAGARHRTLVVRTDEQLQMARAVTRDPELFAS